MPWKEKERRKLVHCKTCQISVTRGCWSSHLKTHQPGKYPCDICGVYKANSMKRLRVHKLIHNIGPESVRDCLFCKKKFDCFRNLERHMVTHTRERPYFCKECSKEFGLISALKTHLKTHDPKSKEAFQCPVCSKGFYDRGDFKKHIARMHLGDEVEKPNKCSVCFKAFITSQELCSHMKFHTGERTEVCPVCEKRFSQKTHLKTHMITHSNERPFTCAVCPKSFKRKVQLRNHVNRVHQKDNLPFKCSTCGRKFLHKCHLQVHQNIHTGDRPFICKICGKSHSTPGGLGQHEKRAHKLLKMGKKST